MTVSKEFLGYGVIGFCVTLIYGVLLSGFVELAMLDPVRANAITFVLVNLLSYFLQSRFVFKRTVHLRAYLRFFASNLLSYALVLAIAYAIERAGIHYLIGYFLIAAIIPLFSFALLKRWVFRQG
jgi:putative flippase GtrA